MRIDIRSRNPIKDGDDVLGKRAFIKVVKNKVAPPFKRAEFDIMFGEGISKTGEVIDLGVEYGVIKKSGSWFSYNDTKLGQGREGVKSMLADNPELLDELSRAVADAMKQAEEERRGKNGSPARKPKAADRESGCSGKRVRRHTGLRRQSARRFLH